MVDCVACSRKGDRVGIVRPRFGEYARAARVVGAKPIDLRNPAVDARLRAIFVCNPNNPTGEYRAADKIARMLQAEPDCVLVLDEAYASFVDERWSSERLLAHGNLVILRSMDQGAGSAWLAIGLFARGARSRERNRTRARALERQCRRPAGRPGGPEPVAEAHVHRGRSMVAQSRRLLTEGLMRIGFAVEPSQANFVLVQVGNGARFRGALLSHRIVVRDCSPSSRNSVMTDTDGLVPVLMMQRIALSVGCATIRATVAADPCDALADVLESTLQLNPLQVSSLVVHA